MSSDNIFIREMIGGDRDAVVDFFANMGEESTAMFNSSGGNTRKALSYVDGNREGRKYWIAEDKDAPGKMAGYTFIWDTDKSVVWFGIAVADEWHGKGVGTKLIRFVIDYCKENGYHGILLSTLYENKSAQRLYEKNGFEKIGKHRDGEKEYLYILRFTHN